MTAPTPSPPRPRLWPAYLATYTFMTGSWAAAIAVPLHVILLGGSLAEAGALAAIRFGLSAFLQLPFGAVIDAWGTRRAMLIATSVNALVNLIPLLAVLTGDRVPFYAWAVLSGLAASLFFPATGAYVALSAPEASRGSAFGWMTLFTHSGVASGPAIGGLIWDAGGPAPTYLAAVGISVAAAVASLYLPGSVRQHLRIANLPGMIGEVARQRQIVGTWIAALAIGLPWGAVGGLFPLYGTGIGLAAGSVGLILASQSLANGASRVPLGRLIDRRRIPPVVAAFTAGGYGLMMAALGFQDAVPVIVAILVGGVVMLAFTLMMVQVTISAVARPELRATGLGGYGTALSTGLGVGPFIAGGLADIGGFGLGFGVIGLIGVVVAMVAAVVLARAPDARGDTDAPG